MSDCNICNELASIRAEQAWQREAMTTLLTGAGLPIPGTPSFKPGQLSGLIAWYDAQDISTITQSGGLVSQWSDKSPKGLNVAQSTASNRPTYSATAFNGAKPAVVFGHGEITDIWLEAPQVPATSIRDFTAFYALSISSNGGYQTVYGLGGYGDDVDIAMIDNGFSDKRLYQVLYCNAEDPGDVSASNRLGETASFYGVTQRASGAVTFRANGIADAAGPQAQSPGVDGFTESITYLGGDGGEVLNGGLGEFILYNRALSPAEIAQVEAYLAARWGL